ncbi:MAG: nucleotidyltransferase domain-containing protein [Planctomycetota bacterium]
MTPKVRRILAELREGLEALYGDRLVHLILFGSQARGDAQPGYDSDIDVLVVLRGPVDDFEERERTRKVRAGVSLEHSMVLSCMFVSEDAYRESRYPLMESVHREGVMV